jgi:hypothetical protein
MFSYFYRNKFIEFTMADEEDLNGPQCHCQGGRLLVIIGDKDDPSISAARGWSLGTQIKHVHKVAFQQFHYNTPELTVPKVPNAANDDWHDFQNSLTGALKNLCATFNNCCYFEEVVIIAHGSQVGLYRSLVKLLSQIIDRPVSKLVFWVCGGNRGSYPFTDSGRHQSFLEICNIIKPRKECPCGCHHEDCHAWNADQDNGGNGKCPVGKDTTVTVLSAGYYAASGTHYPSTLGLDPNNQIQPFIAPDNSLIETTITEDPAGGPIVDTSSKAVTGQRVFGTTIREDNTLKDPVGIGFDPSVKIGKGTAVPPSGYKEAKYLGPTADEHGCTNKDGCLCGRTAS